MPFDTKDFNMPYYLDAARAENFTGLQWLYREIEDAFKDKHIAGVQIVGSPGSGKSALCSQLICSRSSSPIIHTSILGYHFCKYSDKNTQMAGKFVRNLAEMIARRLPEYSYLVSNDSLIKHSLMEDCLHYQDPVGCFELAILSPLKNLTNKPRENCFVVVDALDECITQGETEHSIVYLLNNKIHLFPPWFKVIVTSRNESEAFLHSSKVKTIVIDPEDSRILKDLEIFVTRRLFQETPLLLRLTRWFGDDSVNSITKLTTEVLSKSQGNFLVVNELLNYWEHSRLELRNAYVLPKSLGDLFHSYFKRLYPSIESFKSVQHILGILVSTFEPLTPNQIFELLRTGESSLAIDEYDFKNRLKGLSHFLQYRKDNTLTLYHLFLTEWLISEENKDFSVSKSKGHETFSEYYISLIRETEESKLSGYILNLAQHIALTGMKNAFVQEFINLPPQTVNASDPQNNRTLLHHAAMINNSVALGLVLRHFSCIDCVDDRGITPAFLAAEHGLEYNLALLVEKGAEINRKTKTMVEFNKGKIIQALQQAINNESDISATNRVIDMSFHQSKSKVFDSSLLYAAAQGGHTSVVRYLIKNNACISMLNGGHLTAIQIAAENGHLDVVKTLFEAGAVADKTVLYRAAAENRLEVVNFLLDIGVKDDCRTIDCFKAEQRIFLGLPSPDRDETNTLCDGENDIGPGLTKGHSALEAAVALGHEEVVNILLSREHNARICSGYSEGALLHYKNNPAHFDITHVEVTLGRRPLITYFHPNGEKNIYMPSRDFTESGIIECRKPFHYSVFHLLSYLSPTFEHNNAFYVAPRCRRLDAHLTMCQETGPLAEGIERLEKAWVISSCFDAEGFSPLHRAAQGANLVAIRYFLENGVNTSILSQNGHDALTLAVLHAGRRRLWEREGRVAADADYEHLIRADQAAITLLRHAVNGGFKVRCNSSKPDLTLYHLAASRGLVKFIETLFNESDLHHLDVDCANADGITPIYLANLFQQRVQDGLDNPWKKVIQIIKQHGGEMRYPREDAEYNLIYNGVYGWIPYEFTLDLSDMIKHFITSFLTSYEKSENKSFRCSFGRNLDLARENYYENYYWLLTWLWREINDTVAPFIKHSKEDRSTSKRGTRPRLSREREHFRRDMRRCSLHVTQFRRYLSRILLHKQAYQKNILKNDYWETFSQARGNYWFQTELQILMNMRHTEVFRAFACLKSLSSRLKPVYHLDARSVTYSVRQYEKNPPVDNYLNSICDSLQYIFEGYISFRRSRQQPSEFRLRENEFFSRSGFFNGPVNISRQTSLIGSNLIEWPLEFFLRRSLGFFRRYDYLKTLHIGIEPRTYVHLYPDKIRQLMDRDKMWYGHA